MYGGGWGGDKYYNTISKVDNILVFLCLHLVVDVVVVGGGGFVKRSVITSVGAIHTALQN